jgi:leucyl aminopeptidase
MQIITSLTDPSKTKLDALLLVFPSFGSSAPWKKLPPKIAEICKKANPRSEFSGKQGSHVILSTLGQIATPLLGLLGVGSATDTASLHRCLAKAVRQLHQRKIQTLGILTVQVRISPDILIQAVEEGSYYFNTFTPSAKEALPPLNKLFLFSPASSSSNIARGKHLAEAMRYTRDLANQPPNFFHPATLATEAQRLAKRRKLRCQVWDQSRLKKDGFGGILAVGQGSAHPSRFLRLDYQGGKKTQKPYVIVGKAITFDTGGISIKPSDRMDEMKFDKCGGIAVLGILDAVAALRLPINVTGLISSAENMPSSTAYRPGDIVKTLSGKYIEVLNTDAEGRIVLADALTYAQRLKPKAIVDLATLTGACIICFGSECAAVLGNNEPLINELRQASKATTEKIWPLPLWSEYSEKVKSDIAYVKNTAGREGGTITAACFLSAFVDSKIPWAHLDIAGTAWTNKEEPHRCKGATAFGVRLVTQWLESQSR